MVSLIPKTIISHFLDPASDNKPANANFYQLTDGLQVGWRVVIEGQILPASSRFDINLYSGSLVSKELLKYGDIPLHFGVRSGGGYVVLNSRINRTWGREDRSQRGRLPRALLQNQKFRLTIVVDSTCYHIEVNDRPFISFQHRMSFNQVGLLSYEGEATVDMLEVQRPPSFTMPVPLLPPPEASAPTAIDHVLYQLSFPALPLLQNIKAGLAPGMTITINGRPKDGRFDVSLYQGANPYEDPGSDVPFHMEVYCKEREIVRNSFQSGSWRIQERNYEHFPFYPEMNFKMTIRIESNRYMVSVNDRHLFDFYHRVLPLSSIDHLGIHGNVDVHSVFIANPPI